MTKLLHLTYVTHPLVQHKLTLMRYCKCPQPFFASFA
jgi:uracil phosphoribosyltransferase